MSATDWSFENGQNQQDLPEDCYTGYELACRDPATLAQIPVHSEWYKRTRLATIVVGSYGFLSSALTFVVWFLVWQAPIDFSTMKGIGFFAWLIVYQLLWLPIAILFSIEQISPEIDLVRYLFVFWVDAGMGGIYGAYWAIPVLFVLSMAINEDWEGAWIWTLLSASHGGLSTALTLVYKADIHWWYEGEPEDQKEPAQTEVAVQPTNESVSW